MDHPKASITINGRFLTQPLTGVQRYSYELLAALDQLIDAGRIDLGDQELICLAPPNTPQEKRNLWKHVPVRAAGRFRGNLWEQFDLPLLARGSLLFSPGNIGPYFHPNQVVTIHDPSVFAFPQAYSFLFRTKYRLIISRLGKIAKRVFTVSEFSRKELIARCHIPPERICAIHLGKEHILRVPADTRVFERYGIGKRPYLFHIGSNGLHKNTQALYDLNCNGGFDDIDIVVAGPSFGQIFPDSGRDCPEQIRQLGYISDGELRALYERATALVFPSRYEGFGLPPLEAMALGCPVVCSRASSLPEVCGDAALYFDPDDPEEMRAQVRLVVEEPLLRRELRDKGLGQAASFSWERTASETWEEIMSLILW